MGRLLGTLCAAAMAVVAAPAQAAPVALSDAPRAVDVGIAGDDVVIARWTARGGLRVEAMPAAGGALRPLLAMPSPGRREESFVRLAVAPGVVAALVTVGREGTYDQVRVYAGPPSGPLTLRLRTPVGERRWLPHAVAADGDRLLVSELRFSPRLAFRARVLAPGAPAETVPWGGALVGPAALAGEHVAFLGSRRRAPTAPIDHLYVLRRGDGAVAAEARLRPEEEADEGEVDVTPDGRAVAAVDGALLTVAPGVAPARLAGRFARPRFSGGGIAALRAGRLDVRTPVLLEPGMPPRALGSPSADFEAFEADDRGAAWIANGCVLYAPRDGAPPAEPPAGPCPRAEVLHEEGDQVLRGRRLRVRVTCVAAPASGCRGTVRLGRRGRFGRAGFRLEAGSRRTVAVRLTDRAMRRVRLMHERFHDAPSFALSARVRDGRAHGMRSVFVAGVRR